MTESKRVLLALTSYHGAFYPDGKTTGVFLVEVLHPLDEFLAQGYTVDLVSEDGKYGWDVHSLTPDFLNGKDLENYNDKSSQFNVHLAKIKTADEVNPKDYDIFFASAGHGTLFDFPNSKVQKLAAEIYHQGGVIGAVCHGPIIFDGLVDLATNKPLIEGKAITGFTGAGEKILQVEETMKKHNFPTIEEVATKYHAKYLAPIGPFDDYSVTDGRVVTGVNPASARSTAIRTINALKEA